MFFIFTQFPISCTYTHRKSPDFKKDQNPQMKKTALERKLKKAGYVLKRHGANHDVWTKDGEDIPVPRHSEIKEFLARKILKDAGINY